VTIAAILLAGGQASRFGSPKLAASLGGRPVCSHVALTLSRLPVFARIAVTGPDTPDMAGFGFESIPLDPLGAPLSRSIALGVERAITVGAQAVLIALADMPLVPLAHFQALLAQFDGTAIATEVAGKAMPPAVFGSSLFPQLLALQGDAGARHLLHGRPVVALSQDLALDIDTASDLERAERGYAKGR
jgi:molybdenum cofactor cytidylyltransferase